MSSMLSPGSLQPPKIGTSRWSKALPDAPGIDLDDIYDGYQDDPDPDPLSPQTKDLPRLPIAPPPPRSTGITQGKSWKSTLSALPPIDTSVGAPQSGPPPMMSIPRRPVGSQSSRVYQPAPPPQPPSPSQSISSILSAYSKPDGESPTKPSGDKASDTRQSENMNFQAPHASSRRGIVMSSSTELSSTQLSQTQQQQHHVVPILPVDADIPPPVPSKDAKRRLPTASSASSSPVSASDLNTPSPTRPQIWRRRSVKSDRTLDLPDLKLINSHGSTAASANAPAPAPVSQAAAPPVARPIVPSAVQSTQSYLPPGVKVSALTYQQSNPNTVSGNYAPSAPAPAQLHTLDTAPVPVPNSSAFADSPTMGTGVSKFDRLKEKLSPRLRHRKPSVDLSSESTGRLGAHRPPTPEYQKQDVKTPIIDAFVSPLSPATSPEPPTEVSPDLPKDLPEPPRQETSNDDDGQIPARTVSLRNHPIHANSITRKAVPALPTQMPGETKSTPEPKPVPEPVPLMQETEPFPEHKLEDVAEIEGSEDLLSPLPGDVGIQISPSMDSMGGRAHHSAELATKFPPRGSSVRSNASRAAEQVRYPPAEQDPRLVPSESQGYLYRGRDGTLYPEMKAIQEPHPQAAYFPRQTEDAAPEFTVFKAVPLKESHLDCYQGHRTMNRRSNRNYPLSCQSCEKPDAEDRWVCTFCHLRICEMCFTTLNEHQRDLRQLVNILGHPIDQQFGQPGQILPSEIHAGYGTVN